MSRVSHPAVNGVPLEMLLGHEIVEIDFLEIRKKDLTKAKLGRGGSEIASLDNVTFQMKVDKGLYGESTHSDYPLGDPNRFRIAYTI